MLVHIVLYKYCFIIIIIIIILPFGVIPTLWLRQIIFLLSFADVLGILVQTDCSCYCLYKGLMNGVIQK